MDKSSQQKQAKLTETEPSGTATGIEELRDLILRPTDQRLDRIQSQLEDAEQQADAVSQVLPRAISLGASRDKKLANALQPLTARAISDSIRRDRRVFVDVLFPVMGPAIRKAIATALQGLIQNINQILNHSFSIRGLRWRLEALRTRRPFAEVVLMHTLVYQVEQVFLIHRDTGLLLANQSVKTADAQNPDLVSGMLTAIRDFVQDSFGAGKEDTLDTLQVGDRKVWIEHGAVALLALVIRGNPSIQLKEMMRDTIDEIHDRDSDALTAFDGDTAPFEATRDSLSALLQAQFRKSEKKKSYGAWFIGALVILLAAWALVHWSLDRHRWKRFARALHSQPGIVLTEISKKDGQRHVHGLKDPLAPQPTGMLDDFGIDAESVVFSWEPYQSAYPDYARQRIEQWLRPPETVKMDFDGGTLKASGIALGPWIADTRQMVRSVAWIDHFDGTGLIDAAARLNAPEGVSLSIEGQTLHASGRAPHQWIMKARTSAESLPGIATYNDTNLIDADEQTYQTLTHDIRNTIFYFDSGEASLVAGQDLRLQVFLRRARQLAGLSVLLDHATLIEIKGHADQTGDRDYNRYIGRLRAQSVADLLADAGVEPGFLKVDSAGAGDPAHPDVDPQTRSANRRVTFEVRTNSP